MAVQSIRAPVEIGNKARDHLLVPACQVPWGEVDGIGEIHHLPQEVWSSAEALDNTRHLVTA